MYIVDGHENGNLDAFVLEILILEGRTHENDGAIGGGQNPVLHLIDYPVRDTEETDDDSRHNQHDRIEYQVNPTQVGYKQNIAHGKCGNKQYANRNTDLSGLVEFHRLRFI